MPNFFRRRTGAHVTATFESPGIAELCLDYGRPAWPTEGMVNELMMHLHTASQRDDIDCFVLRSAPGSDFGASSNGEIPSLSAITKQMEQISKPCVAVVTGCCADLGLALALSSDVVLAGRSSRFKLNLGPQTDQVAAALAIRVGRIRANAMLIADTYLDGIGAAEIGLAHQCVSDRQLERHVQIQVTGIRQGMADCRKAIDAAD
ncbi:enoyl-CoA hydratase/isomerase family protein [Mycolicibacterium sp. P9-22]|uniref:enoyl-CoA hydratase/isomerase family protein n=1 Tax=Mycolicibacterium sp. P9-22 TaxID=2024613 RepID=UPI0011EE6E06|nr:enoyl-CoA hydratase/isomerase family protein [Mycolicibacterium sp. P9-22]KAA0109987.1 enoyl-CoA hydratase/isomerase family protein [Mycolicibacterium sp. P9-22]